MIKAHKIRLHPTEEQKVYFAKAAGTARFVWNWALAEWNRQHEAGEKPTALKLKKHFNEIRREQFPWTWEVTKNASDQPFLDLGKAFTAFFAGLKSGKRQGRPKFKSKKKSKAKLLSCQRSMRAWRSSHLDTEARMGRHGGEFAFPREGDRSTFDQDGRLVVCVDPGGNAR